MSDPYKCFLIQRRGARQRRIAWELPYWQWLQIWEESGHLLERGTRAGQWVMGRNGDSGPYAYGNVKIIRVETNNRDAQIAKRAKRSSRPAGAVAPDTPSHP